MINDRFGAQLRQHFLDTANERPADGQLEAAIERVATTSQHRPLVARLTWFPRRTTLFLSPMQRYALLVLALVLALLGLGILAAGGARARTVFEGTWTSTDPGDGSVQSLVVGAGTMPSVRYVDENASGEACRLDPVKVFTAEGEGIVGGPRLRVTYPHGGGCGLTDMDVRPGSYTYDPATDSLVEDHVTTVDGREITVTWNRAVAHVVPTRAPVTNLPPPATLAPTPDSSPNRTSADCSRLLGGSTYARGAGPVVLTATIPLEPATPWNGRQDGFILTDSCTRVPTISINGQIVHAGPVNSCLGNAGVVTTFSEAVARLAADTASGVSAPISLRIDGRDAVRFDVRDLSSCGFGLESGVIIGPGESGSIYVVDMDGIVLSVELNAGAGATQKQLDEARTIVASLRLGAAASPSGSAG